MRKTRASLPGLLLCLLLTIPPGVYAQQHPLKFKHLSLEHGLSQGSIYAIHQDSIGFMWFATEDGLNRYDGYRFKVYKHDPEDAHSLGNNTVYSLYEDREGTFWVGTWEGGLHRYDRTRDRFVRYQHDPEDAASLSHNTVSVLYGDRAGRLWVGTEGGGLNRFDRRSETFTRYQYQAGDSTGISGNWVYALYEDRDGGFWIGTDKGGLNRLDRDTGVFTHYRYEANDPTSLSSDVVTALFEDREGVFWVGTWEGGLNRLDRHTGTFTAYRHDPNDPTSLGNDKIYQIFEDRHGVLWIGTDGGGLNRYDRTTDTFTRYTHNPLDPHSPAQNTITSIYEDQAGMLWLGTDGVGINMIDRAAKPIFHYAKRPDVSNSLSANAILALYEDRAGFLWVGTWGGGLNRLDRHTGAFTAYRHDPTDPQSLGSDIIYAVLEDHQGVLWVGTEGMGLGRLDRQTGRTTHYTYDPNDPGSLYSDYVLTLLEDRQGVLWIGTDDGGLNRYDRATDTFTHYVHHPNDATSLGADRIYALFEDHEGVLWVGTERGGLNRFNRTTETFTRYQHDPDDPSSLSNDDVMTIFEDRDQVLWVGTYGGGLNRFDRATGTFTRYTEKEGLPNNAVYGILGDSQGRLWMSTNKGIACFDPQTESFHNYDVRDGLQSNEFNNNAYFQSRSGELFFGGENGFNVFHPEQMQDNPFIPPVVLTAFKMFNEEVNLDRALTEVKAITLDDTENVLAFEFAALNYSIPEKNQYQYQLEGLHDQWIDLGEKNDVMFTHLDAGAYTLRIKGSNNDGVWNEQGLAIQLIIIPPFWRTWWFRLLMVLAAGGLVLRAYQLRTRTIRRRNKWLEDLNTALNENIDERRLAEQEREHVIAQLEAKNKELEQFTYSVSHDLKGPLITMKGFIGMLEKDSRQGNSEGVKTDLKYMRDAADKMQRLLDELLELSRVGRLMNEPEPVRLSDLAHEAVGMLEGAIAQRGVKVDIAPNMPVVLGDRLRLLAVYQNLIDNATKFIGNTNEPLIEIGALVDETESRCYVRDNGLGIAPEHQDRVFGLFERFSKKEKGTGVGLALVKRIVEVHGGTIWVESDGDGTGSTFWFTLPKATEDAISQQEALKDSRRKKNVSSF